MPALRDYQEAGIDQIRASLRTHRRVLYQLATGGGKTVVFSTIASRVAARGGRLVIVAHRRRIIRQISGALAGLGVEHGLVIAGQPIPDSPVLVGMVQTVARRLDRVAEPSLLIVDEAHHAVSGQYRALTDRWSGCRILGVSATPERLDGKGLGDVFDDMVLGPPMRDLIDRGYLAEYDYLAPPSGIDLSGVTSRGGDFAAEALANQVDRPNITGDVIDHYRRHLGGRPAVVFCVTVAHAEHVAAEFHAAGIAAASVDGRLSDADQEDRINGLADGRLSILTSCELISEGVDVPSVAGVILLRPTQSLALHLQQVGRALRLKPDGSRAVILDHVGNVHLHGMPDRVRPWSLESRKRKAGSQKFAVTTCKKCFRTFAGGARGGFRCEIAPDACPLLAPAGPTQDQLDIVDGELERIADPLAWAGGISITWARGQEFTALLALAGDDRERLRQIQKARGYHHGWVRHKIEEYRVANVHAAGAGTAQVSP